MVGQGWGVATTAKSEESGEIPSPCVVRRRWVPSMERIGSILEREGDALELLLFKLTETKLLLAADEARFLPRATREVERARARARELDLLRAATIAQLAGGTTLRDLAATAPGPWPAILRDHHDVLSRMVDEIDVVAHQNACAARLGLEQLTREPVAAGVGGGGGPLVEAPRTSRPIRNAELDRLARGAALESVLGTAARLRMPDLVDFLR